MQAWTVEEFIESWGDPTYGPLAEASGAAEPIPGYSGTKESRNWCQDDIVEVIAADEGERDGANWIAILKLKNGLYIFMSAGCDYTGWDCRASGSSTISESLEKLLELGTDSDDKERLGLDT